MEFRDLKTQYNVLKTQIDSAIQDVINQASFILGQKVEEFETKLANYVGRKYCVSCGNGTDALVLALKAHNISTGDAVFVPDFTYIASASCISLVGATPVFVDIDLNTFNIDSISLEKMILKTLTEGKLCPRAIIAVDLFGLPANYKKICNIAKKYNLIVVEDAAQGFGGSINGKKSCSFGNISCTSFFPAKPLGCYGDGGAIFTDDEQINLRLRSLRCGGKSLLDKYDNIEIGVNSRLDTLQAAVLIPKLEAFEKFELEAINNASLLYTSELQNYVKTPTIINGYYSSWAQYTILFKNKETRDSVKKALAEKGIPSMIYYPRGLHQQAAFKHLNCDEALYANTIFATNCALSLPIHPYIKKEEIKMVCDVIKTFK